MATPRESDGQSVVPPDPAAGLWWGVTTSAAQVEGSAQASDTAAWEASGRLPESLDGNGFANRYAEDFTIARDLGLTHFNVTLDWSRLEPMEGVHDPAAAEHYLDMLSTAADKGLNVWAAPHHRSTPAWFADLGGFVNERARQYQWVRHLDWLLDTFGDRVFGWTAIHHPVGSALEGHFFGTMPPGTSSVAGATEAVEALLLANHEVWQRLGSGVHPVATDVNLSLFVAADDDNEPSTDGHGGTDQPTAADLYHQTLWDSWIGLLNEGVLRVPGRPPVEVPGAAGSFDLVGFSYYSAISVSADGSNRTHPANAPQDSFHRAMWPQGLGQALHAVADRLPGRPLLLTGTGVATPDDTLRCRVLDENLHEVHRAIDDGVDVRGVFINTLVDSWEWMWGFEVEFGLADRDRQLRPSADVVRRWTSADGGGPAS